MPFQRVTTFGQALDKVIAAAPHPLSVFNYAYLPEIFKPQRCINAADLPSSGERLAILQHTIERLADAGYAYVGMDHFARVQTHRQAQLGQAAAAAGNFESG